jgi:hypothetical protein
MSLDKNVFRPNVFRSKDAALTPSYNFFLLFLIIDQYYKLFTAVIMPLAAYFSMILTELRQ